MGKRLHISKSTVVWTPITKDGKIAGFMMTYPGKYKKYKAYFCIEVNDERKRLSARFATYERAKSLATHVWSSPSKMKLHPTLLKTVEKVEILRKRSSHLTSIWNDVATLSENRETVPTIESDNDD